MFFGLTPQEGIVEKVSALLLLLSSAILAAAMFKIKKIAQTPKTGQKIMILLLVMSGLLFVFFGEEISWGQRLFGWKSGAVFETYNYQNETNLHNFLNPALRYIYPLFGISFFIIMLFVWFFPNDKNSYVWELLLPHRSLFFLLFITAGSTFNGDGELFEALFSLFVFLYSLRIFCCTWFPKTELGVRV